MRIKTAAFVRGGFSLPGRSRFLNRIPGELDIINAYERIRAYCLNCAEIPLTASGEG